MSSLKFVGAWMCIMGAVIVAVMLRDMAMATYLSIMSIAFSQAPSST